MSILVTGASGQLGRLIVKYLADKINPSEIVAAVRSPEKATDLSALGVIVRKADYNDPSTLKTAMKGVKKVLLVSSNDFIDRVAQHRHVVEAAKEQGVDVLVYTSLVHAATSPLKFVSKDHADTEEIIKNAGIPYIFLRNGWYTENYLVSLPTILQHNALLGAAGEGKISGASREDYAEAAANALIHSDKHLNQTYELGGDEAFTLAELAAAISSLADRTIPYVNLPEGEYKKILLGAGLPELLAELLANSDTGASQGGLYTDTHHLSTLIGRNTTPFAVTAKSAYENLPSSK
jgi:NAD(P)H dehydrogenase (quinone)